MWSVTYINNTEINTEGTLLIKYVLAGETIISFEGRVDTLNNVKLANFVANAKAKLAAKLLEKTTISNIQTTVANLLNS